MDSKELEGGNSFQRVIYGPWKEALTLRRVLWFITVWFSLLRCHIFLCLLTVFECLLGPGNSSPVFARWPAFFCSLTFSFHAACFKKGSISDLGCKATCYFYSNGLCLSLSALWTFWDREFILQGDGPLHCRCLLASSTSIHCPHPGFPSPQDSLKWLSTLP